MDLKTIIPGPERAIFEKQSASNDKKDQYQGFAKKSISVRNSNFDPLILNTKIAAKKGIGCAGKIKVAQREK